MNTNEYAIGPGLHDWQYEQSDENDRRNNAKDEDFEKAYSWWYLNLITDVSTLPSMDRLETEYMERRRELAKKEICSVIREALSNLYCNDEDCSRFEIALFSWHYSESTKERNVIHELLEKYIREVVRKEFFDKKQF